MSVTREKIRAYLDDALADAIKSTFARIVANELSMGKDQGEGELRKGLELLKTVHEQAVRIADQMFE